MPWWWSPVDHIWHRVTKLFGDFQCDASGLIWRRDGSEFTSWDFWVSYWTWSSLSEAVLWWQTMGIWQDPQPYCHCFADSSREKDWNATGYWSGNDGLRVRSTEPLQSWQWIRNSQPRYWPEPRHHHHQASSRLLQQTGFWCLLWLWWMVQRWSDRGSSIQSFFGDWWGGCWTMQSQHWHASPSNLWNPANDSRDFQTSSIHGHHHLGWLWRRGDLGISVPGWHFLGIFFIAVSFVVKVGYWARPWWLERKWASQPSSFCTLCPTTFVGAWERWCTFKSPALDRDPKHVCWTRFSISLCWIWFSPKGFADVTQPSLYHLCQSFLCIRISCIRALPNWFPTTWLYHESQKVWIHSWNYPPGTEEFHFHWPQRSGCFGWQKVLAFWLGFCG